MMQNEGFPRFNMHHHTELWKSLDAKASPVDWRCPTVERLVLHRAIEATPGLGSRPSLFERGCRGVADDDQLLLKTNDVFPRNDVPVVNSHG